MRLRVWGKELLDTARFVLGFESAGLHAIAADLHIAPAAGVIFAGVEEEPAALGVFADAQAVHVLGGHEADGALGQDPEWKLCRGLIRGPVPAETRLGPDQVLVLPRLKEEALKRLELRSAGVATVETRVEHVCGGLAQFSAVDERIGGGALGGVPQDLPN